MEVNKLEKETDKLKGLWKIAKNAGWFLPHENICWVSERHNVLHRNERGQLHNPRGMAVAYPDGWGVYALNGVRFTEKQFNLIKRGGITFKELQEEFKDIDQRTQALRFCDMSVMIEQAKGVVIDEVIKLDIQGNPVNWKLYKFPKGEIFTTDAYYCLMDCPSTGKKHFEGVEVSKTVAEAMSWAESNEFVTITPEEWSLRVPLLHEN